MKTKHILILFVFSAIFLPTNVSGTGTTKPKVAKPSEIPTKRVLIVTDSIKDINLPSTVEARELCNLLGHFKTLVSIRGANQYLPHELNNYDVIFYIGYKPGRKPSHDFVNDVWHTKKTVVWINGGLSAYKKYNNIGKRFGFDVTRLDTTGTYNSVKCGNKVFTRGDDDLFLIDVLNKAKVNVIATASSDSTLRETPYIVKSGNLYYVADMPFMDVTQSDRYLLFADLLHEMIGENHPESHNAIVRIEDVTPVRDPQNLRAIADILSSRHIPFLIGVVPFYVNPAEGKRISLSDRPELVQALKYCVENGATIVLHGVTHQYKGVSGIDFEFWNGDTGKPITNEDPNLTATKIETGINECISNGIYPLIWETPHYTASISDYKIFSKYFSTSIDRMMLNEDYKYGQFFPYVINKDIYGQKIFPEDLGYIPLLEKRDSTEQYVRQMMNNARALYNVRDGYASFFFHPFLNPDYLKEIIDGISRLGFTFVDLGQQPNWVRTKEIVILSGSQKYSMNLDHCILYEVYYKKNGDIEKKFYSKKLITGMVSKRIVLKPDEFYMAEPLKKPLKNNSDNDKNHAISKAHS